jgi:hypothetical protein
MSDEKEAEQAAERLIRLAGSKSKAHELIDAAETKGNRGRGLLYQHVDQRLIGNAVILETLWRRIGAEPPKRTELIKRQVEACWRDKGTDRDGRSKGEWDKVICSSLLLGVSPPAGVDIRGLLYDLGANPKAVLRRFRDLPELRLDFEDQGSVVSWSYETPKGHGKSSFWNNSSHIFGARLAPESWLLLHLEHPEWRLLPPDVKWGAFDDVVVRESM